MKYQKSQIQISTKLRDVLHNMARRESIKQNKQVTLTEIITNMLPENEKIDVQNSQNSHIPE